MIFFHFFIIFIPFLISANDLFDINNDYALITSQESNVLDIINLDQLIKITSIKLGQSPAGIDVDSKKKIVFVANPDSNEISIVDLKKNTNIKVPSGKSPLGIAYNNNKNHVFVTNWYDDLVSEIDLNTGKIISEIKVGKSPAGIDLHPRNNDIVVANRESNSISLVDNLNYSKQIKIPVQKSPFGVFFDRKGEFIYVTNVQSNSISIINYNRKKVIKHIIVGEWPYQVAIDDLNNKSRLPDAL